MIYLSAFLLEAQQNAQAKVNNIILGIRTRTHSGREKNEIAISAMVSADFLVFFSQFFKFSNVSVRTNVGETVKSSPNAESTVGS